MIAVVSKIKDYLILETKTSNGGMSALNVRGWAGQRYESNYDDKRYIDYIGKEVRTLEEIISYYNDHSKVLNKDYFIFEGTKSEIIEQIEEFKLLQEII